MTTPTLPIEHRDASKWPSKHEMEEAAKTCNSYLERALKAEAELARIRETTERIERGATSVLLDASLKGEPIHSDVLLEIVKDVRLALRQGK